MADLHSVMAALSVLDGGELQGLIAAANRVPHAPPGLLAWIEHAADWETHRRAGTDFPLLPPDAAIDPSEDAAAIAAVGVLRDTFEFDAPRVGAVFEALLGVLIGVGRRQ